MSMEDLRAAGIQAFQDVLGDVVGVSRTLLWVSPSRGAHHPPDP
jgi:hypothetical protein